MAIEKVIIRQYADKEPKGWHKGELVIVSQEKIDEVVKQLENNYQNRIVELGRCGTARIYLLGGGNVQPICPVFSDKKEERVNTIYTYSINRNGSDKIADELGLPRIFEENGTKDIF